MNENERALLRLALRRTSELRQHHPDETAPASIEYQLQYLIDFAEGKRQDGDELCDLTIGILTVRAVEGTDDELANLLHEVSALADRMRREWVRKRSKNRSQSGAS